MRLIDAEALKEDLHNFFDGKVIDEPAYILRDVFCHIDSAPAVIKCSITSDGLPLMDLRPRSQGEWIDTGDKAEYWAEEYQCSICGKKDHWHNFCPNCGADMRKGGSE